MNPNTITAINKQINEELFSSYLYLSMAAYFEAQNLKGFANWMRVQVKEENDHAMGFFNHILSRGAKVELTEILKPENKFKDVLSIFEMTLEHEKHITACISALYETAITEKDYAVQSLLKWYIDEQVEEEANAQELIDKIKLLGNKGDALFLLDRELSTRQYVPAPILAGK